MQSITIPKGLDRTKPTVLIVGAGYLQKPTFDAAKKLGLQTIVTDRDHRAPTVALANAFIKLDTMDSGSHAILARKLKKAILLVGVFTQGTDVEVSVAQAAQAAGLPGVSPEAAFRCKNKVAFRKTLQEAGIIQPPFAEIHELTEAQEFIATYGLPVILKAIDNSASRGVTKLEAKEDLSRLQKALEEAVTFSTTGTALIEKCLHGEEQSIETFVSNGRQYRINIVDRPFAFDPYPIEIGHDNPTALPKETQEALYEMVEKATKALGIRIGAAKADSMISDEYGPIILEMTARLSGGYHCQATSPAAYGTEEILAALEVAIGKPLDESKLTPKWHKVSLCRSLFPTPGKIVSIEGLKEAEAIHGVFAIYMTKSPGDVIQSYRTCVDRPCFIVTVGDSRDEAFDVFRKVEDTLHIITKPL